MFSFINRFFYKVNLLMNLRLMKKDKISYHANPIVSKSDLQIRTEL